MKIELTHEEIKLFHKVWSKGFDVVCESEGLSTHRHQEECQAYVRLSKLDSKVFSMLNREDGR